MLIDSTIQVLGNIGIAGLILFTLSALWVIATNADQRRREERMLRTARLMRNLQQMSELRTDISNHRSEFKNRKLK